MARKVCQDMGLSLWVVLAAQMLRQLELEFGRYINNTLIIKIL
jgi:hypothetical protein